MRVIVTKDYASLSKVAANAVANLIRRKPNCVIGLPTGGTPLGMYAELIRMHKEEGLDFSQTVTFNLDEYVGVEKDLTKPYNADQSYARFMWEELFRRINIKPENTHLLNGMAKDKKAECLKYEQLIREAGGIDLQIMGIGGDGHFAFNEPGSSIDSRTREVALDPQTIKDNYEKFYRPAGIPFDQMPKTALTMGVATVMEARETIQIVRGENRAEIVAKAFLGPVTSVITSSYLQKYRGPFSLILDQAAASIITKQRPELVSVA